MNATSTVRVKVETGGSGVVAHVGLHALGSFADHLGLGDALSAAIPPRGERLPLHDRGKVLVHALLMLAGGGESCADIEHLRAQGDLFGSVPSDSTLYRSFREIEPATLERIGVAAATVRGRVWRHLGLTDGDEPVVLDLDSSLVEIHSEHKQGTGPNYKGGFGFHPMLCFADATGEALAGMLRPGNAGANTVADHLVVLDQAIAQLPAEIAAGHRAGDEPQPAPRPVVARADSAGCTSGFVWGCRQRNVGFAVVARQNDQIHRAIASIATDEDRWRAALRQDGSVRRGSQVAEVTDLVDLSAWPEGTRLVIRREPLHPGAQQSLFPSLAYRYWGHYTDQTGEAVARDAFMRAHAHVEDHICRLKDSGLLRFPFVDADANRAWLMAVCLSADLVRWFQLACLDGPLAAAEPKSLRWNIFHAPARLVRSGRRLVVRLLDGWPSADKLLAAYAAIPLLV
jgi:hypothetical protein